MGGLKRYLPVTYMTMMIGTLAIAGIPPLAGFFSKDEILFRTFLTNKLHLDLCRRDRVDDRVLHVPADVDDVLRRLSRAGLGACDAGGGARRGLHGAAHPATRTRTARRTSAASRTAGRPHGLAHGHARRRRHGTADDDHGHGHGPGTGRMSRRAP